MTRYPFKFLDAYTREDQDIFFGREQEVAQLYEMIFQADLLLVYGASGTGKTSLIQCGLASRFESHDWLALNIRRGSDLNESINRALSNASGEEPDNLPDWLDEDLSSESVTPAIVTISPLARQLRAVYLKHFKPLYLIFDQFEELYTLGTKDEEQNFIYTVREILRVEQPVKIILSIREEYLGYLYEFERQVPELLRKKLRVEPMFSERVQAVILGIGRLQQSKVKLQAGEEVAIAMRIFEKLRGQDKTLSIQLPYLQVLLDKYYLHCTHDETRQAEATFSLATLDTLGDLGDVLRNFLEEQVQYIARQLSEPVESLWQLLSPFVTLDGTKEPLSEAELQSRLPDSFPASALQALVQRRVLRYAEQTARYEVAHDALAKQLHAHRSDEDIALLEVQRLIHSQVAIKPEAREYFSSRQLAFMNEVLPKLRLTEEQKTWVEQSRVLREQEKAELEERQRSLSNNASKFKSVVESGKDQLYKLEHAKALESLSLAIIISVDESLKKQQLSEPIAELLFFFAEGNRRPDLARSAAELLLQLTPEASLEQHLRKCVTEQWNTRQQFTALWEVLPFLGLFQARYYPKMVTIPLGNTGVFEMGSPESEWGRESDESLHAVQLSAYQMATTPVTFYQFALFSEAVDGDLASRKPNWGHLGDHPVVNVSWYETMQYANWLNEQQALLPVYTIEQEKNSDPSNEVRMDYLKWKVNWDAKAKGFRLPTEAEWELAARGGVGAPSTVFAGSDTLDEVGWYREKSPDKPRRGKLPDNNNEQTHAVKEKKDNGLGLYDMNGNVYEWCWDWYDSDYYNKCHRKGVISNPLGAEKSADGRVIRGGSWADFEGNCRTARRGNDFPDNRLHTTGFRLIFVP